MGKTTRIRVVGSREAKGDIYVVPCLERKAPDTGDLPAHVARAAKSAAARRGFSGRAGQVAHTRGTRENAPATVLVGLGKVGAFRVRSLRKYLGRAVAEARRGGFKNPVIRVPEHRAASGIESAERALRHLALTGYRFDAFHSRRRPKGAFRQIRVVPGADRLAEHRAVLDRAVKTAEGVAITRDLANTPPNEAFPQALAERAQEIAKAHGIKARVLGPRLLEKRGMGGILAVGKGSRRGPRLVELEWGDGEERISLVGKGVTFDTGGISIKPSTGMDEMKFDKSGACTVLGAAAAAASLDLPFRFRAYLPLAENMPDGAAYRPGDIVRCYNGKTVEILNTDAEGRMLLADALALASEHGADTVLDYATLTGACVVALGSSGAGLFSPDDGLAEELLHAASGAGERLWRLPLWPEFTEQMKGDHADLRNTGTRWGGASTAAAFLSQFVKGSRWAHLDIAGPAYVGRSSKAKFGATGYGVALSIAWLLNRAG
ncbi:MAG: leucyl aminopeptidase [Thermoanaerobaculia bacterium]